MFFKPKENRKVCFEIDGFWFDGYYRNKKFVYASNESESESTKDVTNWDYGFMNEQLPKHKEKIVFILDNKKYKGYYNKKTKQFISDKVTVKEVDNWWDLKND